MAERSGFIAAVHSVHSLVCWLSFPALLVIRNAAVNVPVHDLCGPVFAFLGGGLLGCAAPVSFWGAVVCFLTWLPHLTSYWQCEGSNFCTSLTTHITSLQVFCSFFNWGFCFSFWLQKLLIYSGYLTLIRHDLQLFSILSVAFSLYRVIF